MRILREVDHSAVDRRRRRCLKRRIYRNKVQVFGNYEYTSLLAKLPTIIFIGTELFMAC